jgi:hypothetical protein
MAENSALGENCRFKPSLTKNNATSSLMHFHFLPSVNQFCDETNHDPKSPNRQNLFCSYQSVTEVMIQTPDYHKVTQPLSELGVVNFTESSRSLEPLVLYILLDKGQTQVRVISAQGYYGPF